MNKIIINCTVVISFAKVEENQVTNLFLSDNLN